MGNGCEISNYKMGLRTYAYFANSCCCVISLILVHSRIVCRCTYASVRTDYFSGYLRVLISFAKCAALFFLKK